MAERDPPRKPEAELDPAYEAAVAAQRRASHPGRSRLVSANAGSGKTHVLVGRVSRLLLAGAEPDRILCLTYTKAAASEMQARLFKTLGDWSVMDDARLHAALVALTGRRWTGDLAVARGLFARALETPEGLKVQTIHAFCADVLARFPMEAGILPGFDPVDAGEEGRLKTDVRRALLDEAWYAPRSALAGAVGGLARETDDQKLAALLDWMGAKTRRIEMFTTEEGIYKLAEMLGIEPDACPDEVARQGWRDTPTDTLRGLLEPLRGCKTKTEPRIAGTIERALVSDCALTAWDLYHPIFFKTDGGLYANGLCGAKSPSSVQAFFGCKAEPETEEIRRVRAVRTRVAAARSLERGRQVRRVAGAYARTYREIKRARRVLDFNDQIELVHRLLRTGEAGEWVRYKLDAGIAHILVDEAQDTSPLQWEIVDALREEFAATRDRRGTQTKTFFAVGDEKQSIFGFQGADPAEFAVRARTGSEGGTDGEDAELVRMEMSFRSSPDILRVVDAVFSGDESAGARMFASPANTPPRAPIRHSARRSDRGRVELWPVVPVPEAGEEERAWDPRPVDATARTHPKEALARHIADTVADWLARGEPVFDRDLARTRPMAAGDVFVLVCKRGDFFDAVIRHLKRAGVPVAGADRLLLSDAVVVRDLVAMARWALFPHDDLSLAEVLRSPLVGLSEDDLFHLAHRRDGTLWAALRDSEHTAERALLDGVLASVADRSPYAFFATLLDRKLDGLSLRARIERRLGVEARDPLQAFLGEVLGFQRRTSGSLQHFVQSWEGSDVELKREPDGQGRTSEVRIMTVHGAKGLQAPVVILPQTTTAPPTGKTGEPMDVDGVLFERPPKSATPAALQPHIDRADAAARQEYLRLLYVAMTRAESRLVVCGYPQKSNAKDLFHPESWYAEVKRGIESLDARPLDTPAGEGSVVGGGAEAAMRDAAARPPDSVSLPPWIDGLVAAERAGGRRVTPSRLLDEAAPAPVRSPLERTEERPEARSGAREGARFLRGNLIHTLLERLPNVKPAHREAAGAAILARHGVEGAAALALLAEAFGVLEGFPDLFRPGSLAEVSLAGQVEVLGDLRLNAQLDRVSVLPDRVVLIDYKSNRPPPRRVEDVSPLYLAQMAAYRELAREVWARPVECALLWTDRAELMVLPDAALDAALLRVRARFGVEAGAP